MAALWHVESDVKTKTPRPSHGPLTGLEPVPMSSVESGSITGMSNRLELKERHDLQQLSAARVPRVCRRCGVSNVPAELWAFSLNRPTDLTDRVSLLVFESPFVEYKGKPCPLALPSLPGVSRCALLKCCSCRVRGQFGVSLSEAKSFIKAHSEDENRVNRTPPLSLVSRPEPVPPGEVPMELEVSCEGNYRMMHEV